MSSGRLECDARGGSTGRYVTSASAVELPSSAAIGLITDCHAAIEVSRRTGALSISSRQGFVATELVHATRVGLHHLVVVDRA